MTAVPPLSLVVLKVTGPCNLNCDYCYVYNGRDQTFRTRPARLSDDLARALCARLTEYCAARPGHRVSVCLHGGEPLLLGRERFARLVALLRAELGPALGSLAVQTNAVLVDEAWAALLRDLRVSVSVSLDGTKEQHDAARVDHAGRGTYDQTVAGVRRLLDAGVHVAALCVARPGTSGADAYRALRALGLTSIDFLLPDVSHDDYAARYGGLGEAPAAAYLIPAIDAWLAEDDPAVEVRFFADLFRLAMGGTASTDAFGGPMPYVVVETDGSIQANDALRVGAESLGETGLSVVDSRLDDLGRAPAHVVAALAGAVPTATACLGCAEERTCRGGYLPHRYSDARGFDNPSVWCADLLSLFRHVRAVAAAEAAS